MTRTRPAAPLGQSPRRSAVPDRSSSTRSQGRPVSFEPADKAGRDRFGAAGGTDPRDGRGRLAVGGQHRRPARGDGPYQQVDVPGLPQRLGGGDRELCLTGQPQPVRPGRPVPWAAGRPDTSATVAPGTSAAPRAGRGLRPGAELVGPGGHRPPPGPANEPRYAANPPALRPDCPRRSCRASPFVPGARSQALHSRTVSPWTLLTKIMHQDHVTKIMRSTSCAGRRYSQPSRGCYEDAHYGGNGSSERGQGPNWALETVNLCRRPAARCDGLLPKALPAARPVSG